MTHTYHIEGMTCNSCVGKVKSRLLQLGDVSEANVQLQSPQATITMQRHIPTAALQSALRETGSYTITEADGGMQHASAMEKTDSWFATYKPLLLVFGYIITVAIIVAYNQGIFNWMMGMNALMSGFFLAFSFFKLLDLNGFADSYATYDILAKRFRAWGFIYPFIELGLGIAYAANWAPLQTNMITLLVMSVSLVGVLQSVLKGNKMQCACLGTVFNLPMSTVTIVEDAAMILMSGIMIISIL